MNVHTAESKVCFLEGELSRLIGWVSVRKDLKKSKLSEFLGMVSSLLKELSNLKFKIEETKIKTKFDDTMSIRQAEILRDELIKRAELNESFGKSVCQQSSNILVGESVELDVDTYYFQAKSIRDLVFDIEAKLHILKVQTMLLV